MHPPFFPVDHKVDSVIAPIPAKSVPRRVRPARLAIGVPAHACPHIPRVAAPLPPAPFANARFPLHLQVVPPPQPQLRDRIGRFLIRLGQRMIFQNRARGV